MDLTIDPMLAVYAAALRRHRQHLEDGCDRKAWHEQARRLVERAVWSANSTDEPLRREVPWRLTPSRLTWNER